MLPEASELPPSILPAAARNVLHKRVIGMMMMAAAMSPCGFVSAAAAAGDESVTMELPPPLDIKPSELPSPNKAAAKDMIIIYEAKDTIPSAPSSSPNDPTSPQAAPSDEFPPLSEAFAAEPAPATMQFIPLGRVTFASGKWELSGAAKQALDYASAYLAAHPGAARVLLDGHTDWVGGIGYNDKLSDKRAMAVEAYLSDKGIATGLIHWRGHGKHAAIDENWTRLGRERNRQVEIYAVYLPER